MVDIIVVTVTRIIRHSWLKATLQMCIQIHFMVHKFRSERSLDVLYHMWIFRDIFLACFLYIFTVCNVEYICDMKKMWNMYDILWWHVATKIIDTSLPTDPMCSALNNKLSQDWVSVIEVEENKFLLFLIFVIKFFLCLFLSIIYIYQRLAYKIDSIAIIAIHMIIPKSIPLHPCLRTEIAEKVHIFQKVVRLTWIYSTIVRNFCITLHFFSFQWSSWYYYVERKHLHTAELANSFILCI